MVAEPTAKQRKMFASMGLAMPDGSFYIRTGAVGAADLQNAIDSVGRASPTSDQTEVQRRNAVRRHIIKRADDLGLKNKIPDTWAPDGSLKHYTVDIPADNYLAHFGRKGMKWGEHVFAEGTTFKNQLDLHTRVASGKGSKLDRTRVKLGMSAIDLARHKGSVESYSKERASLLQGLKDRAEAGTLTGRDKYYIRANSTAVDIARRRSAGKKAEAAQHDETDSGQSFEQIGEDFLAHFGRKGMKWGEHVFERDASPDAARASATMHQIKSRGIHSVTNGDLQHLVGRLNLEQQHARLTSEPSHVKRGHETVKQIIGAGKTATDAYETGVRVFRTGREVHKLVSETKTNIKNH